LANVADRLPEAHAWYGDTLEYESRNSRTGRVLSQLRLELRGVVAAIEVVDGFPDDIVHEQGASGDPSVKLRGDQTRLLPHNREATLTSWLPSLNAERGQILAAPEAARHRERRK
jgi:hypothetical protein